MTAPDRECDLLVIGSGAGGLAAAVTAAHRGLRVIVVEAADVVGGTSAWSGGWIYAPRTPQSRAAGIDEPAEDPLRYLQAVIGPGANLPQIRAFLQHAPAMAAFFEDATHLGFDCGTLIPDTYGHLPGAGTGGRSLSARPMDGRALGPLIHLLRRPLKETTLAGMTIQAGSDLRAFLNATRSFRAFHHVAGRLTRHMLDLVRHGRAMQLRNGQALIGRLLLSASQAGVEIIVATRAGHLLAHEGRVTGAALEGANGRFDIRARHGVVLATGGIAHAPQLATGLAAANAPPHSLAVPTANGDGFRMAQAAGGYAATGLASPLAMCPVSDLQWPDGTSGLFPHIIDRGKPGVIAVTCDGRRFCNEGLGYHDVAKAILDAAGDGPAEAWLICDHRFLRRYGLGIVRPAPMPYRAWLRNGYLRRGATPAALANACGIDPERLQATLARWNHDASTGQDTQFGRGTSLYMRLQGDPGQTPNPCMRAIRQTPFYAVRIRPGSFGAFAGLATDDTARVLRPDGQPIAGLYAVGADMASVMGGFYPAGGINLGPALTFGYIAALHAADQPGAGAT